MVSMLGAGRRAQGMLYTDTATVYAYNHTTDEHGVDKQTEYQLLKDIPCRLSFDRKTANEQDMVGDEIQEATMHCAPEYIIPEGSKIVIVRKGVTYTYECSSKPAVYESHQEVECELYRKRA